LEYFGIFYEVFGIFCGDLVYFVVIWYILWWFGIFCGDLVYFVVIWYILSWFGIFCGDLVYFVVIWYILSWFGIFCLDLVYFVVIWYILSWFGIFCRDLVYFVVHFSVLVYLYKKYLATHTYKFGIGRQGRQIHLFFNAWIQRAYERSLLWLYYRFLRLVYINTSPNWVCEKMGPQSHDIFLCLSHSQIFHLWWESVWVRAPR
jgi:hypothetical protein